MAMSIGWLHPQDVADRWKGFNDSGIEHFAGRPLWHLAREILQNVLDAAAPTADIVTVKFRMVEVKTDTIPDVAQLRENLKLCLQGAPEEGPKAEKFFKAALAELAKEKIRVLEITDHNTTGMVGPCVNGKPYYAYMKANGQSKKSSTSAGSFGIGKYAPYAVSKLRTVFVSTVYKDDTGAFNQLTQGKSIFISHDNKKRRMDGEGFWGVTERCQPVEGIASELPQWVRRVTAKKDLKSNCGTKLSILGFEAAKNWRDQLSVSIAENFFGAIADGRLRVEIDAKYTLDQTSIAEFFKDTSLRAQVESMENEPEQFDNSKSYLATLLEGAESIVEHSEMLHLGNCQLRIIIGEGLPKKVCILRKGMFITDSLNRLKNFSDFKEFVAVVQCQSTKGNELLRAMEPPRHDVFEPDRLPTPEEQKKGAAALRELSTWVRDMLKRHAKDPVSEVTELDELRDFFGDEGGNEDKGRGGDEINPFGKIIIRAKPLPQKKKAYVEWQVSDDGEITEVTGGANPETPATGQVASTGNGGNGSEGGATKGAGGGEKGETTSGTNGAGRRVSNKSSDINNVRAVLLDSRNRRVLFTPVHSGKISLRLLEAGADSDYDISISKCDTGVLTNGAVQLDVTAGKRCSLTVELNEEFLGALKVMANEI